MSRACLVSALPAVLAGSLLGCTSTSDGFGGLSASDAAPGSESEGSSGTTAATTDGTTTGAGGDDSSGASPIPDVFGDSADTWQPEDRCVADDLEQLARGGEPPDCADQAPPDSFDPALQWSFSDTHE